MASCPACDGLGWTLHLHERPGSPNGNRQVPCPSCTSSTTPPDVERLARIIDPDAFEMYARDDDNSEQFLALETARAILAAGYALRSDVLEEAAKVADEHRDGRLFLAERARDIKGERITQTAAANALLFVAAAIRALKGVARG